VEADLRQTIRRKKKTMNKAEIKARYAATHEYWLDKVGKLTSLELAEWAVWQTQNWLHIIRADQRVRDEKRILDNDGDQFMDIEEVGSMYGLSIYLWKEFPEYIKQREAVGELPNYQAEMDDLFNRIVFAEFDDDACDPQEGSSLSLSSAEVEEKDGEVRDLTDEELEGVNEYCAEGVKDWAEERFAECL
jgi:hypothetical protein